MSEADPQIPVEPVDETETVVETEAPAPKRNKRRLLLMLSVPLLLLIAGGVYWLSLQGKVTTDNAYIHPEPYKLQIAQANAAIAGAHANVTALSNSSDLSGADISAAREDIAFAQSDFERNDALYKRGFVTKADHDAAQHRVNQAKEALRQALARQEAARAKLATGSAVPGENPQVAAA